MNLMLLTRIRYVHNSGGDSSPPYKPWRQLMWSEDLIPVLSLGLGGGDLLHGFPLDGAILAGARLGRLESRLERLEPVGGHVHLLGGGGGGLERAEGLDVDGLSLLGLLERRLRLLDEVHVRLGDWDGLELGGRGLLVGGSLGELLDLVPHGGALTHALLGDLEGILETVGDVAGGGADHDGASLDGLRGDGGARDAGPGGGNTRDGGDNAEGGHGGGHFDVKCGGLRDPCGTLSPRSPSRLAPSW